MAEDALEQYGRAIAFIEAIGLGDVWRDHDRETDPTTKARLLADTRMRISPRF